ncbi:MAG: type I restriction enzyme HsdR N-terminal domain-containing protein [Flavobacteriales bacterium]
MMQLSFPHFDFKVKTGGKGKQIFDPVRRKYILLTPEEWVRQHVIAYLKDFLGYPAGLLSVEKAIELNGMSKRYDVVAFNNSAKPILVVECKAPDVKISQAAFNQIARYNLVLKVDYLFVTNGLDHFVCHVDANKGTVSFIQQLPKYFELV